MQRSDTPTCSTPSNPKTGDHQQRRQANPEAPANDEASDELFELPSAQAVSRNGSKKRLKYEPNRRDELVAWSPAADNSGLATGQSRAHQLVLAGATSHSMAARNQNHLQQPFYHGKYGSIPPNGYTSAPVPFGEHPDKLQSRPPQTASARNNTAPLILPHPHSNDRKLLCPSTALPVSGPEGPPVKQAAPPSLMPMQYDYNSFGARFALLMDSLSRSMNVNQPNPLAGSPNHLSKMGPQPSASANPLLPFTGNPQLQQQLFLGTNQVKSGLYENQMTTNLGQSTAPVSHYRHSQPLSDTLGSFVGEPAVSRQTTSFVDLSSCLSPNCGSIKSNMSSRSASTTSSSSFSASKD